MAEIKNILSSPVQIYALGGLGEVGKNLYCVENDNSLIIIDCGVMFPDASMPGIDYVIPDFGHLRAVQSKIKALIITHGHEDHIGGIPFLLQQIEVPIIYAPKIAAALIRHKISDNKIKTNTKLIEYEEDSILTCGDFNIEFFHVTHSIPDSFGLYITTPQGTIVESGDFKIDLTPVDNDFNLSKLSKFADRGIDLLLADSTNAEKEGYTPSERNVIQGINNVFSEASGRILISTFSSNISRIQQIIETALRYKRKIVVFGRSMESNIDAAREYGYIKVPDAFLCSADDLKTLSPSEVCILCTGTQGEPMSVLSRIAKGEHKTINIIPGDTVVFSSSVIPGNTQAVNIVVNQLTKLGASVITNSAFTNLHASGHASKQEMRLLQKLTRPTYFMPIHGEYRMLKLHGDIAKECGVNEDNIFICQNGDVLSLYNHKVSRFGQVQADSIYIDGKSTIGLSTNVMKERDTLTNEGVITIFALVDNIHGLLLSNPIVESRGFLTSNKKSLQIKLGEIVGIEINRLFESNEKVTFAEIKNTMRVTANHLIYRESHRNPLIIPVVLNKNMQAE